MGSIDPSYLSPSVRLEIGDTDPTSYRYTDDWIDVTIISAIKALSRWWNRKYQVDENKVSLGYIF